MSIERNPITICGWLKSDDKLLEMLNPILDGEDDLEVALDEMIIIGNKLLKHTEFAERVEFVSGSDDYESGNSYIGISLKYIHNDDIILLTNHLIKMNEIMNVLSKELNLEKPSFYNVISWY